MTTSLRHDSNLYPGSSTIMEPAAYARQLTIQASLTRRVSPGSTPLTLYPNTNKQYHLLQQHNYHNRTTPMETRSVSKTAHYTNLAHASGFPGSTPLTLYPNTNKQYHLRKQHTYHNHTTPMETRSVSKTTHYTNLTRASGFHGKGTKSASCATRTKRQ